MAGTRESVACSLLLLTAACRDSVMRCPGRSGGDVDSILDRLDRNASGDLTEEDLERGESLLVFRLTREGGSATVVSSMDARALMIVHPRSLGLSGGWGDRPLFGAWHEFTECSAGGWATTWFANDNEEENLPSDGSGPLFTMSFDIAEIEHGNIGVESTLVAGHMHVVSGEGQTISGHLEGSASSDIISYSTQAPTGQHVEVLSHVFREIPIALSN